ncbi:hypothetical protein GMDG_00941 [Pseudogymnoascus destructans 20631-21]|uniref:ATPase AAA-type core domain-containing protein n=1 Tax=Pseudogymnoascus destructans (strain ATCC MYA-4855 / 20631-21) TaxID=658429 RepID=L8FLM7_PSED2|nr:hypothetical protein GMDG_00941 [Pseudogymnoascus destructans 20631-21]
MMSRYRSRNTLLLLNEADDFLCKRSYDSNHNSLVSVFLRKLEYYKGIMLLTMNWVRDFDEAVQSRIHVGIKYSPLGVDTRKAIWRSFLEKAKTETGNAVYSDKQLNVLAKQSLNGRQASIKNATVLEVGKEFENDFRGSGEMANMFSYA